MPRCEIHGCVKRDKAGYNQRYQHETLQRLFHCVLSLLLCWASLV